MPKRRDKVSMTDDEIWSFIEGQKTIQVGTINRDGTPHLVPLWFAVVDGQEKTEYDRIGDASLSFSPDSKRVVYAAMRGLNWLAIVDGQEQVHQSLGQREGSGFEEIAKVKKGMVAQPQYISGSEQRVLVRLQLHLLDVAMVKPLEE